VWRARAPEDPEALEDPAQPADRPERVGPVPADPDPSDPAPSRSAAA
jgi:hypothetical protein